MNKLDLSDYGDRLLPKILSLQAQQAGDTEYLITDDRRITFAQADDITNRLAAGLAELGVGSGDRVAFYIENGPECVLIPLAVNKLGAIWVPINTDYKGEWLSDTIVRSRCKVLITESGLQERIADVLPQLSDERFVVTGSAAAITLPNALSYDALCEYAPITPDYSKMNYGDTCAVLWTSGTTGRAKGVCQSHNCWIRPIVGAVSPMYNSREGDVIYNVLPLFNSGAWITAVARALIEGIPLVLEKRFSVTTFWDRIKQFGATQTFTLGAMHMFLWNAPARDDDKDNPLRIAQMVPMPEQLAQPFCERFGIELLPMGYGQSECMLICTAANHMGKIPFSAMGYPLDDMELALLDDNNEPVAAGEVGEVCIKPLQPHVIFNGYFEDPEAQANAYSGEWYHTGDLGKQDPSGAFWFVDRKKDAVRFGGRDISTMAVEMILRKHPAVKDVAAFGIPSKDIVGESELAVNIVLQADATATPEELARFVNDNAPYYFIPQFIEFVDALPYTPTNKVQKFKLREKGLGENAWSLKASGFEVKR